MTNLTTIRSVVVPLSVFVTGLLAGVMLGVAMEQQTAQKLPEAAWTLRQQNDDALFRRVMPFTFIAMMLLLVASLFLLQGRSRIAMVAATVSALAVIVVTAAWEVPINNEIVKWTPGSAPADWIATCFFFRSRWRSSEGTSIRCIAACMIAEFGLQPRRPNRRMQVPRSIRHASCTSNRSSVCSGPPRSSVF